MQPFFIFSFLIILIDLYVYKGLKLSFRNNYVPAVKLLLKTLFWLTPSVLIGSVLYSLFIRPVDADPRIFNGYFYIVAFTLLFYIPKLIFIVFHLVEDILYLSGRIFYLLKGSAGRSFLFRWNRRKPGFNYLSRAGIIIALIPFFTIIYGVAFGRFDFRVINMNIELQNLPESFDGFKIVQISDLHIGSFYGYENRVIKAIEMVNAQNPDLIVFTGDLVNNFTAELDGFTGIISELKAPFGIYSVLGNHDYGDYYQWDSGEAKQRNMQDMIDVQKQLGFRLLLNQWDSITINGESIAIIGVENWGKPPFPKYGDLEAAMSGTENMPATILLSHDPSHWDAEVLGKTGIDLTLSGHTHGMQFGIENRFFRWSPGQIKYPRWAGLYVDERQHLYVNRGLGYIAFPGRIGMPPEITVIELRKAD